MIGGERVNNVAVAYKQKVRCVLYFVLSFTFRKEPVLSVTTDESLVIYYMPSLCLVLCSEIKDFVASCNVAVFIFRLDACCCTVA